MGGYLQVSERFLLFVLLRQKGLPETITNKGIGGILLMGEPNKPLLEIPVGIDKAGVVVVGGLNPIAAIEESDIQTVSKAMSTLYEYSKLKDFKEILKGVYEKTRGGYKTI